MRAFVANAVRAGLASLIVSAAATAQVVAGGDLQRFTPSGTPYAGFSAAAGDLLAPGEFAIGAHFNYARNPLVYFQDGSRIASTVRNNSSLQLHLALGIFERLELGIALPLVLQQNGNDPRFSGLPSQAVGDLRIRPRIQILSIPSAGFFLTLSPTVTIPLSRTDSFSGESGVRLFPELGASWRLSGWFISADALFRWRPRSAPLDKVRLGNELEILVASGRSLTENLEAIVELEGGLALETASRGARGNPLEALGGLRYRIGRDWTIDGAMGLGILAAPGVPDYRAVVGFTYGAGRPRPSGQCILHAPDGDEVMRLSGYDRDGDGIDDACDLCPYQAGPEPGGCPVQVACAPAPEPLKIASIAVPPPPQRPPPTARRRVEVLPIEFDFDSDVVRESSLVLIKRVVDELSKLPPEMLVRVLGHTDVRGKADYNVDLSKRRAASVVAWMIRFGVEAQRLSSDGFGYSRPVAAHDSEDHHQRNRRVEFVFSMPDDVEPNGAQQ